MTIPGIQDIPFSSHLIETPEALFLAVSSTGMVA